MNVEIGTEPTQFPEKEYINGIFVAVYPQPQRRKTHRGRWTGPSSKISAINSIMVHFHRGDFVRAQAETSEPKVIKQFHTKEGLTKRLKRC
jgi:hypothetical protein